MQRVVDLGAMQAKDHFVLAKKMKDMPKLKPAAEEVGKEAKTLTETMLASELAQKLGISESVSGLKSSNGESVKEPEVGAVITPYRDLSKDIRGKSVQPARHCNKTCGLILSDYLSFEQQVTSLPEDHPKKTEPFDWCVEFEVKLRVHYAKGKKILDKVSAMEDDSKAGYADTMMRRAFMTKQNRIAKEQWFEDKMKELVGVLESKKILMGKETHDKLRAELEARPKIES